jgi:hypothetical protein
MYVQKCKLERNNRHVNNDNVDDDDDDKDIERDFSPRREQDENDEKNTIFKSEKCFFACTPSMK